MCWSRSSLGAPKPRRWKRCCRGTGRPDARPPRHRHRWPERKSRSNPNVTASLVLRSARQRPFRQMTEIVARPGPRGEGQGANAAPLTFHHAYANKRSPSKTRRMPDQEQAVMGPGKAQPRPCQAISTGIMTESGHRRHPIAGSGILHRRIEVLDRGPPQIPAVVHLVIRPPTMHRAAVVPDDKIADRPTVGVDELRLCRVFNQLPDQYASVRDRPAKDV